MEVKVDNNSCEIAPLHVAGCRQCNHGVTLEYICKTDFGSALAAVRCATTEFHAHCNRFGQPNRHYFRTDKHILHEQCTVTCPQGTSSFPLEATLATLDSGNSTFRHAAGIENLAELHWSDVTGFLGDAALFVWHSILLFDIKVWLVTAVVVVLASIAMLGGFRYLERNYPDLLRLLLLAVVLPSISASQRHPRTCSVSVDAASIHGIMAIALGVPLVPQVTHHSIAATHRQTVNHAGGITARAELGHLPLQQANNVMVSDPRLQVPSQVCGQKDTALGVSPRSEVSGPTTRRPVPAPRVPSRVCGQSGTERGTAIWSEVSGPYQSHVLLQKFTPVTDPRMPSRVCGQRGIDQETAIWSEMSGPPSNFDDVKLTDAELSNRDLSRLFRAYDRDVWPGGDYRGQS